MSKKSTPHYPDAKGALEEIVGVGILRAHGTTVPTDATAGYAPGCIFHHTDGATGATVLYVNVGSSTSCDFDPVFGGPQAAAPTAADGSTVDGTYGAEEAAVIGNHTTRIGEIIAALQAVGIMASS